MDNQSRSPGSNHVPSAVQLDRAIQARMHDGLSRHSSNQSASTVNTYQSASTATTNATNTTVGMTVTEDNLLPSMMERINVVTGNREPANCKGYAAMRRPNIRVAATIRQHYYPEGGWGWIICGCSFLVQVLTTGMQLSYGVLCNEITLKFGHDHSLYSAWPGVLCWSVSLFSSPFVVALCRRKSIRLTAVFGGLVVALGCLFASFAHQIHQVFLSYGVMLGIGVALTRETSNLMIGQYFKRRREFVEVIVQSGAGIGITLFSVFFRESIKALGWRLGLQAVTVVLVTNFFLGVMYRSASLYHPQRRAILHLKNQRKKIKEKNKVSDKPPYFEFAAVRQRSLQIIMLSTGLASFGLYTPLFFLAMQVEIEEGSESSSVILLQTFVGFAFAIGSACFGCVVVRKSRQCMIGRQYLCQASLFAISLSILSLTVMQGYHSYVLFTWVYGVFMGGYNYALKMYTMEKVRARHFSRAWSFVIWSQALPVLFGVPVAGYINKEMQSSKSGYYFSCSATFVGASALFLMNMQNSHTRTTRKNGHFYTGSGTSDGSHVSSISYPVSNLSDREMQRNNLCDNCSDHDGRTIPPHLAHIGKSISFASSVDIIDPRPADYLTCISEEGLDIHNFYFDDDDEYFGAECITSCNKVENYLLFSEFENNVNTNSNNDSRTDDNCSHKNSGDVSSLSCSSATNYQPSNHRVEFADEVIAVKTPLAKRILPFRKKSFKKRGILRRSSSSSSKQRRSITVIEEMTTSV